MTTSRSFFRRVGLVLCCCVVLGGTAASAARITLVITDKPNQGFLSTKPAISATGNPAPTLGQQRQNAFAAAAREWERLLVSNVNIRVDASWDSLTCTVTSGTLASAGPNFVVSDFRGAPRPNTWYAEAVGNALARSDQAREGSELTAIFNDSVGGSPGCLGGLRWDYSIGAGPAPANAVSFVDVTRHELAHGLGFVTFVNGGSGERLLNMDDAYMLHLEDHGNGLQWGEMNNAQRSSAATAGSNLHWVGPQVLTHSQVLTSGADSSSGHVRMNAPSPLSRGSSVSHFDPSLVGKFDEMMEPSETGTSANLLSLHLMQDVGWGVDFTRVQSIDDVDRNGVDDLVVLRADRASGKISSVVVDPRSLATLSRAEYTGGFASVDLGVVSNFGGTAADEVAAMARDPRTGTTQVFISDADSGERLQTLGFDPQFVPVAMTIVPNFGGTPADEVAALLWRGRDEATRVIIKDASSGTLLRTLSFAPGHFPVDIDTVPSFGGGPAAEVAILVRRPADGSQSVSVRDAATGAILASLQLSTSFNGLFLATVPNFGGGPAAELAVVGVAGSSQVVVVDASSGSQVGSATLDSSFLPTGLTVVDDFGDSAADELVVIGRRSSDRAARVFILDASSGFLMTTIGYPATRVPLHVTSVANFSGAPADEIGLLISTETDARLRVFVTDPDTGQRVSTVDVPFDSEVRGTRGSSQAERVAAPGQGPVGDGDSQAPDSPRTFRPPNGARPSPFEKSID